MDTERGYSAEGDLDVSNPPNGCSNDCSMDTDDLDAVYDAEVKTNAHDLAIQLILRSILLKINSMEAHELMRQQLHDQVQAVSSIWLNIERSEIAQSLERGEFNQETAIAMDDGIVDAFDIMSQQARDVIDGIFDPPTDVAGIL